MSLKIVVLAKQVPDTRNVGKDAMTAEGTVNRAALPAIFNPEDLNALEQALRLKEQNPGSTVGILTMGPPRAGEIIRQGLYRGADTGWLPASCYHLPVFWSFGKTPKHENDRSACCNKRSGLFVNILSLRPEVSQREP